MSKANQEIKSNDYTIPFTFTKFAADHKPQGKEIAKYQRINNYQTQNLTIEEIYERCSTGYAWRAGVYKEGVTGFSKRFVEGSYIIALDFDEVEFTPKEVYEYAVQIGLPPSFYYWSYSQDPLFETTFELKIQDSDIYIPNTEENPQNVHQNYTYKSGYNYRLVWVVDQMMTKQEYEGIVAALIENVFAAYGPGPATKDISRLWFGGLVGGGWVSNTPVKLDAFKQYFFEHEIDITTRKDNFKRKKNVKEFIERNPAPTAAIEVNEGWQDYLLTRCFTWKKWVNQEYIPYLDRRNLWANLAWIKYHDPNKHIVDDVLAYYEPSKWVGHSNIEEEIRTKMSQPDDWTPRDIVACYDGSYCTVPQFFETWRDNQGTTYIVPDTEKCTLQELDSYLDTTVPQLLANDEFIYFTSQTGSGKTERVIDYLINSNRCGTKKVIYAVPYYTTAKEFVERLEEKQEFTAFKTYLLTPNDYTEDGLARMSLGLASGNKPNDERFEVIQKLYMEGENGLFVVTHALLSHLVDVPADLIIVDENIEEALLPLKTLTIDQLEPIKRFIEPSLRPQYEELLLEIERTPRGKTIDLSFLIQEVIPNLSKYNLKGYLSAYAGTPLFTTGIYDLTNDNTLYKTSAANGVSAITFCKVSSIIKESIENNIPVKLFTATPMNHLLETVCKVQPRVVSAPPAKNEGTVIQYRNTTGARGKGNSKVKDLIQTAKETLPQEILDKNPIFISFKGTNDLLTEEELSYATVDGMQLHFGNNRGLDFLKGQTLVVLGKPDKNQDYYYQLWDLVGDGTPLNMSSQYVVINGVRQKLFLFNNPTIRNIQLQNLEYALAQTVGRARALREVGAEVYIFANYVCADVNRIYY